MTADEIRNEYRWDGLEPEHTPLMQVQVAAELAAQVAELNESRKPRWVNLSSTGAPCLIDATQVIGLSCGHADSRECVFVRLRGQKSPFYVFDKDHDEVRFLLGLDEEWMHPPQYMQGHHVSNADYDEMMAIVDTARKIAEDPEMLKVPTGAARDNIDRLTVLFDSFDSLPF